MRARTPDAAELPDQVGLDLAFALGFGGVISAAAWALGAGRTLGVDVAVASFEAARGSTATRSSAGTAGATAGVERDASPAAERRATGAKIAESIVVGCAGVTAAMVAGTVRAIIATMRPGVIARGGVTWKRKLLLSARTRPVTAMANGQTPPGVGKEGCSHEGLWSEATTIDRWSTAQQGDPAGGGDIGL